MTLRSFGDRESRAEKRRTVCRVKSPQAWGRRRALPFADIHPAQVYHRTNRIPSTSDRKKMKEGHKGTHLNPKYAHREGARDFCWDMQLTCIARVYSSFVRSNHATGEPSYSVW